MRGSMPTTSPSACGPRPPRSWTSHASRKKRATSTESAPNRRTTTAAAASSRGSWMKGGQVVGATDAIGLHAIEQPYHFRDIHTTILHQLGLDHEKLIFQYAGRPFRLTDVHGRVVKEVLV